MLQQTTVTAVIPYFQRWMARFPDVRTLAAAREEDVLALWQGLGYYSRARNLLAAARAVVANQGGRFPDDPATLRALPGFGPYTAAAVAAFAFDRPEPPVDTNIVRVVARLCDFRGPVDRPEGRRAVEAAARAMAPARSGGRKFFSALMDLGATACKTGAPDCAGCPLREDCRAENPSALPVKRVRRAVERVAETRAWVVRDGKIGLVRSAGPRWRGLWLLPEWCGGGRAIHVETYPVTRFMIRMSVVRVSDPTAVAGLEFFSPPDLPPMPTPHARAVKKILLRKGNVHD